tara:strand:+ start:1127 stop:1363 length:237 start_codon:yes stop_codon:yes gene_type:complete
MKIVQDNENGGGEIQFSWREVWIMIRHRKVTLTPQTMKILVNSLINICMNFNINFSDELQKQTTRFDQPPPSQERKKD